MKSTANFKKGSNEGFVELMNTLSGKRWFAVTATKSKTFKTLKGAEKFVNAEGYNRIKVQPAGRKPCTI